MAISPDRLQTTIEVGGKTVDWNAVAKENGRPLGAKLASLFQSSSRRISTFDVDAIANTTEIALRATQVGVIFKANLITTESGQHLIEPTLFLKIFPMGRPATEYTYYEGFPSGSDLMASSVQHFTEKV